MPHLARQWSVFLTRWQQMTKYYVDVDDDLAARLQEVDDDRILDALRDLVEEEAPPADELMHSGLSEAEKKRREIRRIRRRGTALGTRPDYE
jgi:hypothetical protein